MKTKEIKEGGPYEAVHVKDRNEHQVEVTMRNESGHEIIYLIYKKPLFERMKDLEKEEKKKRWIASSRDCEMYPIKRVKSKDEEMLVKMPFQEAFHLRKALIKVVEHIDSPHIRVLIKSLELKASDYGSEPCLECGQKMKVINTSRAKYATFILWSCNNCGNQHLEKKHTPSMY